MSSSSDPVISDVRFSDDLKNSKYIKTKRIEFSFQYKGKKLNRLWDYIEVHDAVGCLLFHSEKNAFIFVRQFRPAVYAHSTTEERKNPYCGFTFELCAGIIDKKKPLVQIMQDEILEECGYLVPLDKLVRIGKSRGGVGVTGNIMTFYFACVDESMKKTNGGGLIDEGEMIELAFVPISEWKQFLFDETKEKAGGIAFPLFWFHDNIFPTLKSSSASSKSPSSSSSSLSSACTSSSTCASNNIQADSEASRSKL
eukprot:TRINITY_DN1793_c0_g1_i1.p1 TRINITY_DN1793_c0_g1~~TRINITY_DN1793_c0_g1_i1.p1  ORF type:complete len:254 (-),score=45.93 TRINITY_DN1793_c0_g1_i1:95-856(-)